MNILRNKKNDVRTPHRVRLPWQRSFPIISKWRFVYGLLAIPLARSFSKFDRTFASMIDVKINFVDVIGWKLTSWRQQTSKSKNRNLSLCNQFNFFLLFLHFSMVQTGSNGISHLMLRRIVWKIIHGRKSRGSKQNVLKFSYADKTFISHQPSRVGAGRLSTQGRNGCQDIERQSYNLSPPSRALRGPGESLRSLICWITFRTACL